MTEKLLKENQIYLTEECRYDIFTLSDEINKKYKKYNTQLKN